MFLTQRLFHRPGSVSLKQFRIESVSTVPFVGRGSIRSTHHQKQKFREHYEAMEPGKHPYLDKEDRKHHIEHREASQQHHPKDTVVEYVKLRAFREILGNNRNFDGELLSHISPVLMPFSFVISPLDTGDETLTPYVEVAGRVLADRNLTHRVYSAGTTLEGSFEECNEAIVACVEESLRHAPRVLLNMQIDVRPGAENRMHAKMTNVNKILCERKHEYMKGETEIEQGSTPSEEKEEEPLIPPTNT